MIFVLHPMLVFHIRINHSSTGIERTVLNFSAQLRKVTTDPGTNPNTVVHHSIAFQCLVIHLLRTFEKFILPALPLPGVGYQISVFVGNGVTILPGISWVIAN